MSIEYYVAIVCHQAFQIYRSISSSEIHCISPRLASLGERDNIFAVLTIDDAVVIGGQFKYIDDPDYDSVQPQSIISA